jgi:hypothetical protein
LTGGLFEKAKEKIDDNITLINNNIKEMESYFYKMGSKKDNKSILQQAYNTSNLGITLLSLQEKYLKKLIFC